VSKAKRKWDAATPGHQGGFTLLETLVSLIILLAVSGIVMTGMMQLMQTQGTIANRTEMHTSVRSATELLQQEIGQAGMVSLPVDPATGLTIPLYMTTQVALPVADVPWTPPAGVFLSSVAGIFNGEQLVVDTGLNQETVTVICANPCTNPISATFNYNHAGGVPGTPVTAQGAFATGIVPPTIAGGSTGTVLKLYGDINGDGNMLYVEYTCDWQNNNGFGPVLFRNEMPYDTPLKAAFPLNAGKILLSNLDPLGNPNDQNGNPVPCFTYQTQTVGPNTFVTDVAVTLTEQTQNLDPQTHQFQKETKALLNVSPRNVFNAWELASAELTDRVQPMPPSVTGLIGQ